MAINPSTQLTPNMRCLNLVVNGSSNNDRVSARILMKSILLSGSIYYSPLVNDSATLRVPSSSQVYLGSGSSRNLDIGEIDRSVDIFVVYYPRILMSDYPSWGSLLETPITTRSLQDETNVFGARILLRKTFRLSVNATGGTTAGGAPLFAVGSSSRRDFRAGS